MFISCHSLEITNLTRFFVYFFGFFVISHCFSVHDISAANNALWYFYVVSCLSPEADTDGGHNLLGGDVTVQHGGPEAGVCLRTETTIIKRNLHMRVEQVRPRALWTYDHD